MNYNTSTPTNDRLQEEQHGYTHGNHVNRERKKRLEEIPLSHTQLTHTHTCTTRGSRVRRYEATNNNDYSTSFSLPSTLKCTHAHTITHNKKSTGEHTGFMGIRGGGMWFCSGGVRDEETQEGFGRLGEPILPMCGSRSACPPVAEHTRP